LITIVQIPMYAHELIEQVVLTFISRIQHGYNFKDK
jgi:hypothetical protein